MQKELPDCPVETALLLIGGKWKILILRELLKDTKRFGELMRSIRPISQKMLTQQLREMEHDGLVARKVYAEIPPRVEYSLTDFGRTTQTVLNSLADWGNQYKKTRSEENRLKRAH